MFCVVFFEQSRQKHFHVRGLLVKDNKVGPSKSSGDLRPYDPHLSHTSTTGHKTGSGAQESVHGSLDVRSLVWCPVIGPD